MLAAYGDCALRGRTLSYAEWYGLWLNLDRVHDRQAAILCAGVAAGMGDNRLPENWFDALARFEPQAGPAAYAANAARMLARVRAKRGG